MDDKLVDKLVSSLEDAGVRNPNLQAEVEKAVKIFMNRIDEKPLSAVFDIQRLKGLDQADPGPGTFATFAAIPGIYMVLSDELKRAILENKTLSDLVPKARQKISATIERLIRLANKLDSRGLYKQADIVDEILKRGL